MNLDELFWNNTFGKLIILNLKLTRQTQFGGLCHWLGQLNELILICVIEEQKKLFRLTRGTKHWVLLAEMLIWYDFHVNWFYLLGQQVPVDLFCEMGLICKSLHCIMLLFVRLWEKTRLVWRMKKVPWMMGILNTG